MSFINKDRILNENPVKKLLIGFNHVKENLTQESAYEYKKLYEDKNLSFLLENSEMIFKEPYYGYDFYRELLEGTSECEYPIFRHYENEREKVKEYLDANKEKMSTKLNGMYDDLLSFIEDKCRKYKNCGEVFGYAQTQHPELKDQSDELCDDLHSFQKCKGKEEKEKACHKIRKDLDEMPQIGYFIFSPFVNRITKNPSTIGKSIEKENIDNEDETQTEKDIIRDNIESYCENSLLLAKLMEEPVYEESVKEIPNVYLRSIFYGYGKENIMERLHEFSLEHVDDATISMEYASPKFSVNQIFNEDLDNAILEEEFKEMKIENLQMEKIFYEKLMDIVVYDYTNTNDIDSPVSQFHFFEEGTTIGDAVSLLIEKNNEIDNELFFSESSDDLDEELRKYEKEFEKNNKKDDENIEKADKEDNGDSLKKVEAPKVKNLSNKIQFKAQDAEVKQLKKMGEKELRGQEKKNALKAVAQLPKNFIDNIKKQIKSVEEKDDERRIKYMTEPGFRKKAFRNMKLSLLYGTVAQMKLALIPITAMIRHFSKEKDRRIRNELLSKLETEIKICDEKINDANSEGDKKEKYELMRIKAKLERELLRVRTNSRYI